MHAITGKANSDLVLACWPNLLVLKQYCSIPLLDLNEGTLVTVGLVLSGFQGLASRSATAVHKGKSTPLESQIAIGSRQSAPL